MRISGLFFASLIVAAPLAAQEGDKWVGAQVGFLSQGQDSRGAKDVVMLGATAGAWLTNYWGVDVGFQVANLDSNAGLGSGSQQYLTAARLFNSLPDGRHWNIYVKAGAGIARIEPPWSGSSNTTTKSITLVGLGARYKIGESGLLGGEFQLVRFSANNHEWPFLFTAGWRFGGVSKSHLKK